MTTTSRIVERDVGPYRDRAVYSSDALYRYQFDRDWADTDSGKRAVWVLLNPATGDTDGKQRPTLGRCIKWSQAWGYSGLSIVNLFAYRATKPRELLAAADPVGPENDAAILRVARDADRVIAAWGAHGRLLGRGQSVAARLRQALCLGHTARGEPRHPLYVPSNAELVPLARAKPAQFEVLWPDTATLTVLAVVDRDDTSRGWVRWTWEPDGVVVQNLGQERLLAQANIDFEDPATTRQWVQGQGFEHVSAEGPWPCRRLAPP